jgi:hypothetical protein
VLRLGLCVQEAFGAQLNRGMHDKHSRSPPSLAFGDVPEFRGTSNKTQPANPPNSQLPAGVDSVVMLRYAVPTLACICDGDHNDGPTVWN